MDIHQSGHGRVGAEHYLESVFEREAVMVCGPLASARTRRGFQEKEWSACAGEFPRTGKA